MPPSQSTSGTLDELRQYLDATKRVDEDVARYAASVSARRLGAAGHPIPASFAACTTWVGFASTLSYELDKFIHGEGNGAWLTPLFTELIHVALVNPAGHPMYRVAALLAPYLQHYTTEARHQHILALLPPEVAPALVIIEEWEAEAHRRGEESGY